MTSQPHGGPGLVRRLVIVTLCAGVVSALLGAFVVQLVERRSLLSEAHEHNLAGAVRTAALIDSRIDAVAAQLELAATSPGVRPNAEAIDDQLAVIVRATQELDLLVVHDLDGRPVAASAASRLVDLEEVPPRVGNDDGTVASDLEVARERTRLLLTVPIEDPPGTTIGWLSGASPLSLFSAELTRDPLASGRSAELVTRDGTVIAHGELDRVLAAEQLDVEGLFGGGDRTAQIDRDGETVLLAASRLRSIPGWLVIEQPRSVALAPIRDRATARTLVLIAVLTTIVAVVVITSRRLLQPLRPLAHTVERIGAGERGVEVETDAAGEVAVLADGIERMARSLEDREDELRRAEVSARESEERLRLMVEGVEDYAIVLLAPDTRIRTWNTGARRLLGHTSDAAIGRKLSEMLDPSDPPPDPVAEVTARGPAEVEGWCRRADGTRFWAAIATSQLRDDAGAPYGYAVIIHDRTERRAARKAVEDALEREQQAAAELRRANDLKDEFLAIAAHEIRTPLSVILGASRLLGRDAGNLDEHEALRLRGMLEDHAESLRGIVDRLLDFTRLQAGKVRLDPEPVPLADEIAEHVRSCAHYFDEHELRLDVAPGLAMIDRAALRHIVANLVSNAAKFSPRGSTIEVTCRREGREVVISVADEGVGVAADDHERIFELFRQGTRDVVVARGTGVGLAIVKGYLDLLHGTITVTSAPGEGAVFTVRIPADG